LALHQAVAEKLGLHVTDLRTLDVLQAGPASAGELSSMIGLTSGATTRLLDRLESTGHIRRRHDPNDRRKVMIETIPEQMAELDALYRGMATGWERLLETLDDAALEELESFFQAVHEMTHDQIQQIRLDGRR
jgi:DNA-binding MarR family transcriptional regulator